MLRSMKDMEEYSVGATDGIIGRVSDFYFDDDAWVIRYMVVAIGDGPARRKVLISPISIGRPDWSTKVLPVRLTRGQISGSPDIDTEKPVSRQQEMGYLGYYGYGNYWGGGGLWGAGLYPDILQGGMQREVAAAAAADTARSPRAGHRADQHLRSGNGVMRYYVHASDGDIGHVQGFLVDEQTWAIRYLIVNTSNWWLGHQVIIAPQWIANLNWAESTVTLDLTRAVVKDAPLYDPQVTFDRAQEAQIHTHYGRTGYWPHESGTDAPPASHNV
jgi:hypothetical protein